VNVKKTSFAAMGENCAIAATATFCTPERIFIGNNVTIEDFTLIDATYGDRIVIGDNVLIKRFATLISSGHKFDGGYIELHRSCHIGMHNLIAGHAGVSLGESCILGPFVSINGYQHNFEHRNLQINQQGGKAWPIVIQNDVYIATRSSILAGPIGTGAVISAHSLVTKPVERYSIVRGVPAKFVRHRS